MGRFLIELTRGDIDRGIFWGGLSTSQLTSIAVLAAVCWRVASRPARADEAKEVAVAP